MGGSYPRWGCRLHQILGSKGGRASRGHQGSLPAPLPIRRGCQDGARADPSQVGYSPSTGSGPDAQQPPADLQDDPNSKSPSMDTPPQTPGPHPTPSAAAPQWGESGVVTLTVAGDHGGHRVACCGYCLSAFWGSLGQVKTWRDLVELPNSALDSSHRPGGRDSMALTPDHTLGLPWGSCSCSAPLGPQKRPLETGSVLLALARGWMPSWIPGESEEGRKDGGHSYLATRTPPALPPPPRRLSGPGR